MPRPQQRRRLAPFALALALLSAAPCAVLAAEDSCCGASAGCGGASEAPCAQLAAAPCCEAPGAALERTVAPNAPAPPPLAIDAPAPAPALVLPQRAPEARLRRDSSIRTVVLRL